MNAPRQSAHPNEQEVELKFELDPQALDRLEAELTPLAEAPAQRSRTLVSVYYDTPERALQKAGMTLRVRKDGARHIQTVKAEGDGLFARGEWEYDLKDDALNLDALMGTPVGSILDKTAQDLRPVFATRTKRTRRLIHEPAGEVEAALDRGQIEAEGRTAPLCELELELKTGQSEALFGLARRLARTEPLRLSFQSKAERGFRLIAEDAPEACRGETPQVRPGMSVAEAFAAIGAEGLKQLAANAQTLRHIRRPEALHQARVAIRRLRTAMKLFEQAVRDGEFDRLMAELKWLGASLDQARDLDVMIADTFRPAAARLGKLGSLGELGKRLHTARGLAYDESLKALDSARAGALMLDLAAWLDSGPWRDPAHPLYATRGGAPIEAFARDGLERLRRQIRRRGKDIRDQGPDQRHKLRIRAKRLRYAVEFFAGLHERAGGRGRFLTALRGMQDALGELNDIEVARRKGPAFAAGSADDAFAAGLIVGVRAKSEKALARKAVRHYERLYQHKPFWRD